MEQRSDPLDITLDTGNVLRLQVIAPHTFRIRLSADGHFPEPGLVRYGIVRSDPRPVRWQVVEREGTLVVRTAEAALTIWRADGQLSLARADGTPLLRNTAPPYSDERGFGAEFALADGERLYGLGDVTRERIQKRGYKTMMWVVNVESYVPIPYVMSSRGWAMFINTTWRHFVDLGHDLADRMRFWGDQGRLDYYLFVGDDYAALLDHYTDVTGKPHLLPLWGYGLTFVCNQQADAREMLDDCLNFRREGIPCDLIGLEPGWMSKYYDYTLDKDWHPERFYIPPWAPKGPQTFLGAAERLGFKVSLWLCCDYDLSYEEERRVGTEFKHKETRHRSADDFEVDYHFHNPVRMDKITRPEEPWFEHLKKFVDQGVSAFKMDGANQVNEHPDRCWGNGMSDEEMHNLYPVLLNKQMHIGFKEHTGRRPMIYSSGGYAGIQRYSATWAGDTGGGPKPLVSMLNHGMSGHVNTSCDMHVFTPEGIHFGFLQSWSQVCSWAYWRHPWLLGEKLLPIFKFYARLRYRLLPYIYSMAHIATRTGMPIMRAIPLVYPDDPRADELLNHYMLGDSFLTAAFADQVYLPAGRWIDFWTGQEYKGPQEIAYTPPTGRGGPLFVRAGAIIPTWPDVDYVGQREIVNLGVHVYLPTVGSASGTFTLYEDDGETFAYLDGAVALTRMTCTSDESQIVLSIGARQGSYEGMPDARTFDIYLHRRARPAAVWVDDRPVEEWSYDPQTNVTHLRVAEDERRQRPRVVRCDIR